MGFVSLSAVARRHGARVRVPPAPLVLVCQRETAREKARLRLVVRNPLLKSVGWLPGDRVDVLYDPATRTGLIRRVTGGDGLALSFHKAKDGKAHLAEPAQVMVTYRAEMQLPFVPGSHALEATAVDGQILWALPAAYGTAPAVKAPPVTDRPPDGRDADRQRLAQQVLPAGFTFVPENLVPPARGDKQEVYLHEVAGKHCGNGHPAGK